MQTKIRKRELNVVLKRKPLKYVLTVLQLSLKTQKLVCILGEKNVSFICVHSG